MREISGANDEQHAGIEQVNDAVAQMDQVTQQNAALVEEAAAAAASMQDQAARLLEVVGTFKLDQRTAAPAPGRRAAMAPRPARSLMQATPKLAGADDAWDVF
jgi:methyl-accepting chemotaxis protein